MGFQDVTIQTAVEVDPVNFQGATIQTAVDVDPILDTNAVRPPLSNMLVSDREQVTIEISASGDNQIIATPGSGHRIQIVHLDLLARDIVDVRLLSDAVQLSGLMNLQAGQEFVFNAQDGFTLSCEGNDAFVINLNGAVSVSGSVSFYREAL